MPPSRVHLNDCRLVRPSARPAIGEFQEDVRASPAYALSIVATRLETAVELDVTENVSRIGHVEPVITATLIRSENGRKRGHPHLFPVGRKWTDEDFREDRCAGISLRALVPR